MAASGTYTFTLPIDDLLDEAAGRLGGPPMSGIDDGKAALRTLNLLFTDLENRGILLWALDTQEVSATASIASYALASATEDVVDAVWRSPQTSTTNLDIAMTRLSYFEYNDIPVKSTPGRPSQYFVDRQTSVTQVYLYPVPVTASGSFRYTRLRYLQDSSALSYDTDTPRRFWPTLVSGMAYYLGMKRYAGMPDELQRIAALKALYEGDLALALEADRERTSFIVRMGRSFRSR